MKLNWKYFIIGLNGVIIIGVVIAVLYSLTQKYDLVEPDAYEKGLKYQKQIDKIHRTARLPGKITLNSSQDFVDLTFPKIFNFNDLSGKIKFYRPASAADDFEIPLQPDANGVQNIPMSGREKGYWKVMIDWKVKDSAYFFEDDVMVR